jgi:hypothetical protein
MRLTRAVTHIRLCDANHAKIAALDALAAAYLRLRQQSTPHLCTAAQPKKYAPPCFASPLSQRWQRVAIQHAAGSAQSWRANAAAAYHDDGDRLAEYPEAAEGEGAPPAWKDWQTPVLTAPVLQAHANVARLPPSENRRVDYWLRLSTREHRQPLWLPVRLAAGHRQALAGKTLRTRTSVTRTPDGWWLTRSEDGAVPVATPHDAPALGWLWAWSSS